MKKFLIVGLGNIGLEYANTRHNIGFKIVDHLADNANVTFSSERYGALAELRFKGSLFFLLKPTTYMNLSGKAVKYWMDKQGLSIEQLLVITDDINLPFGTVRINPKGSDGGHNGLKNIQEILNSNQYPRLRFGVGGDFQKGRQVDYVLGQWTPEEMAHLSERLEKCKEAVFSFGTAGLSNTMTAFNGK
jgi:PTH1 family peptidyl-tRNA hydrolase